MESGGRGGILDRREAINVRHGGIRWTAIRRLRRCCLLRPFIAGFILAHLSQLGACDAASFPALAGEFTVDLTAEAARAGELAVASHAPGMTGIAGYTVTPPSALFWGWIVESEMRPGLGGPIPLVGGRHVKAALAGG